MVNNNVNTVNMVLREWPLRRAQSLEVLQELTMTLAQAFCLYSQ